MKWMYLEFLQREETVLKTVMMRGCISELVMWNGVQIHVSRGISKKWHIWVVCNGFSRTLAVPYTGVNYSCWCACGSNGRHDSMTVSMGTRGWLCGKSQFMVLCLLAEFDANYVFVKPAVIHYKTASYTACCNTMLFGRTTCLDHMRLNFCLKEHRKRFSCTVRSCEHVSGLPCKHRTRKYNCFSN